MGTASLWIGSEWREALSWRTRRHFRLQRNKFCHEPCVQGNQSSVSCLCPSMSSPGNSLSCYSPLTQLLLRTLLWEGSEGVGWLPGSGRELAGDYLQSGLGLRGHATLGGKATLRFLLEGGLSEGGKDECLIKVAVPHVLRS